jgi:hypothetical protein
MFGDLRDSREGSAAVYVGPALWLPCSTSAREVGGHHRQVALHSQQQGEHWRCILREMNPFRSICQVRSVGVKHCWG